MVVIIGARFNRWWTVPKHFWFFSTMPKMLAELAVHPDSGFLGWERLGLTANVQYGAQRASAADSRHDGQQRAALQHAPRG